MLEKIVGKRFKEIEDIKLEIEKITNRKITSIIESESDMEGLDNMIDYEFELFDIHTLFYLKDNSDRYYITEV